MGIDVTVTDAASSLADIHWLTTPTAASPTPRWKTISNLATNDGSYVAIDVTVTDVAFIAQLTAIDADNTDGSFTYTSLEDNASNLVTNDGSYVAAGTDVTVDAASIAQLTTIDADNTDGSLTYTLLEDNASNLAPTTAPTSLLV